MLVYRGSTIYCVVTEMQCPYCGNNDSRVIDSRDVSGGIRRRRQCLDCNARFTTYERLQPAGLFVVKRDQRREEFDKDKLLSGIRKACEKRPFEVGVAGRMADEIEAELYRLGKAEVDSIAIGDMVMEKLKKKDYISYIRFASVYRKFTDITELKEAVDNLVDRKGTASSVSSQLPLLPEDKLATSAGSRRRRVK